MTETLLENGEETCGVQQTYFERGYPSHGAEVSEVRSKVLRNEVVAQSDDKSSGVL